MKNKKNIPLDNRRIALIEEEINLHDDDKKFLIRAINVLVRESISYGALLP